MNPQGQEHTPSFELPTTQSTEQVPQSLPEQQGVERTEKQSSIAVEHAAAQQMPSPPPAKFTASQATAGQPALPPGNDATAGLASTNAPQVADDADLIEKEWVLKAKEIVARTAHDPHLQNKEMNKFKADYMKKRYNKDIRLSED